MFEPVERKTSMPTPTPSPLPSARRAASPAALKANQQSWTRQFSGSAQGIHFQLRVQREPSGHLHARYQVTPGHQDGWHLEGQVREDDTFALRGANGAVFEGRFLAGGLGLVAHFRRGTAFEVKALRLTRTSPGRSAPRPAPPGPEGQAVQTPPTPAASAEGTRGASGPAAQAGPDGAEVRWQAQTTGLKGFDLQPDVQAAILWGAQRLNLNPNDLAATIGYETAGSFSPGKENEAARRRGVKGAVGFVQFTPSVGIPALNEFLSSKKGQAQAQALGISVTRVTRSALLTMTPMEQMRFVVLYFKMPLNALPANATYDKIYQKILAPARNGEVWYTRGDGNYERNAQFDTNKDGQITRFEAAAELRKQGFVVNYFQPVPAGPAAQPPRGAPRPAPTASPQPARQPQVTPAPAPVPTAVNPRLDPASSFDERVTQVLTSFTQAYHFPVAVRWQDQAGAHEHTIQVQTPYYINSGRIQASVRRNRASMPAADLAVFRKAPATARLGKASPEQMQEFAQVLVRDNPFRVPPAHITGALVTAWLKKYGIGVDCSGFVTQALDHATTQLTGKDPHLGDAKVRVNRASGSLHGNNQEFQKIATPREVRPGDTMWLSGHIRIVLQVGPGPGGKGLQMMIAESTPNTQLPVARAERITALTGVDRAIWWFSDAHTFTRKGLKKKTGSYNWEARPTDQWESANTADLESFYFSRYRPLARGQRP